VKTRSVLDERGSVLVEVVAFAVVGFGLVLTLGLNMLEQERKVLELQSIARNSMRSYLLHTAGDLYEEVSRLQSTSKLFSEESIDVYITCEPTNCELQNSMIWLELSVGGLSAKAFGVNSG
jgi:hypothetical protein